MATDFGKILRIIRINTGDLAKTMAEKLGISVPYLNAIENGRRDIPNDMEEKVLAAYELSEHDKMNLHEAIISSKDRIKIDLTELAEQKRRVIITLAKEEIDTDTLDEICRMINERKDRNEEQ